MRGCKRTAGCVGRYGHVGRCEVLVLREEFAELARPSASPDPVNNPPHYTSHPSGIECLTIVRHMGFNLGNVVKYVWRADLKGAAIEDLEKAAFYLADEIAKRKKKEADR